MRTGTNLHLPWSDRSRAPLALFGVFGAAVCAAIFAPYARSYFFFFDDFHLLDYAAHHSLAETFITTQHGNYRPAAFLFWKTWLRLFGVAVPAAFSSLHLVAHTLNSILLGLILLRFRSSTTVAWSAAAFFLVFPPANEAVFWMSAGYDVYGMTFLLLSVLAAGCGLDARRPLFLVAMSALAFAGTLGAMLCKETGYIAFVLVASLAWLNPPAPLGRRVWLAWAVAFIGPVALFFVLRGRVIPLSHSSYGDPRNLFLNAPWSQYARSNFRALFTFGHFGAHLRVARACKLGGLLMLACLAASFFDPRRRPGVWALALTLALAMVTTLFTDITPGAAFSGRLLYVSGMIVSILSAVGLQFLASLNPARPRVVGPAMVGSLVLVAATLAAETISLRSFAFRFRESTAISRSILAQATPLADTGFVHVRNLPFMLKDGPYLLKCYAFRDYFQLRDGRSPMFRCDKVDVDHDGVRYIETTARQPDNDFSDYSSDRPDERELEIVY